MCLLRKNLRSEKGRKREREIKREVCESIELRASVQARMCWSSPAAREPPGRHAQCRRPPHTAAPENIQSLAKSTSIPAWNRMIPHALVSPQTSRPAPSQQAPQITPPSLQYYSPASAIFIVPHTARKPRASSFARSTTVYTSLTASH